MLGLMRVLCPTIVSYQALRQIRTPIVNKTLTAVVRAPNTSVVPKRLLSSSRICPVGRQNKEAVILALCATAIVAGTFLLVNYHPPKAVHDSPFVKLVIFVPAVSMAEPHERTEEYADRVRSALEQAGAGTIKGYTGCSFTSIGEGRFRKPVDSMQDSEKNPIITVPEYKIEVICPHNSVGEVLEEVQKVHPYKVMGHDIIPLIRIPDKTKFIAVN